jgi:hypothetical protein
VDQRVRGQHGFEPPAGGAGPVADLGEMVQVAADLAFVPVERFGGRDGLTVTWI